VRLAGPGSGAVITVIQLLLLAVVSVRFWLLLTGEDAIKKLPIPETPLNSPTPILAWVGPPAKVTVKFCTAVDGG
jgi:hypothetical protein